MPVPRPCLFRRGVEGQERERERERERKREKERDREREREREREKERERERARERERERCCLVACTGICVRLSIHVMPVPSAVPRTA